MVGGLGGCVGCVRVFMVVGWRCVGFTVVGDGLGVGLGVGLP